MKILVATEPDMLWFLDGPMIGKCTKCGCVAEADPAADGIEPGKVAAWPDTAHGWGDCPQCGERMIFSFRFDLWMKDANDA